MPVLFICRCSDRQKENLFDPGSQTPPSINFTITPLEVTAILKWSVNDIRDFDGFRLYRSLDNDKNFTLYKELTATTTSFTDTALSQNRWYYYRLTLVGGNIESLPSQAVKILPGPGKIWILSRYGYNVKQISYDLLHTINTYNTNYPPANWDWDQLNNEVWLAHAQYRLISRLNLNIGYEDFFFQNDFQRPVDIKLDQQNNNIIILDSGNGEVYFLHIETITDSIKLDNTDFFKLNIISQSKIAVLGKYGTTLFNSTGSVFKTFSFDSGYVGQDMNYQDNTLFILATDFITARSQVFSYDPLSNQQNQITVEGNYTLLRKPVGRNYFWMGEFLTSNSCRAVQLSLSGDRQLELPNLSGSVDDIGINPYDHSLILVQRYSDNIVLYDSSGTRLSNNNQIYDPIKVYIE